MIKIGDVLILEPRHSEKPEKYKCRVVEKTDQNIFIDYPINTKTNKTVFLLDGMQLKANFIAGDGSIYIFDCEVLRRVKLNIPMIVLPNPDSNQLVKIQRRQFVRVETAVDVAVHPIVESEFQPIITVTEDISAGGAAIINHSQVELKPNMLIQNWFVLPLQNGEIHYLKLKSKIVRIAEMSDSKPIVSVQFVDISQNDRQLLLRFCFDRQLAYKKKGL